MADRIQYSWISKMDDARLEKILSKPAPMIQWLTKMIHFLLFLIFKL